MRLTPLDIREQQFRRVMRGMDPDEVTAFLASVAAEFESLLGENKVSRQRLLDLEEKLSEYRNMEKGVRRHLRQPYRHQGTQLPQIWLMDRR